MLLGRIGQLVFRRSIHLSQKLSQEMGIDGNTILAESLKKQVSPLILSWQDLTNSLKYLGLANANGLNSRNLVSILEGCDYRKIKLFSYKKNWIFFFALFANLFKSNHAHLYSCNLFYSPIHTWWYSLVFKLDRYLPIKL